MAAPQPEEIYARTREEGKRRLSRPVLELGATALVGGFDVGAGIGYDQLFANLGISVAANLVGGLVLVTFVRSAQAVWAKA